MATETAPSFDPRWDERARGPRMSNVVGRTIHKYPVPVQEEFIMSLPRGAEIIRIADQGGFLWMWCVVDTHEPFEDRFFHAVKTGAAMPATADLVYRGWAAIHIQAELALYFFEEIPRRWTPAEKLAWVQRQFATRGEGK